MGRGVGASSKPWRIRGKADLFGDAQLDLFGDARVPPQAYVPHPRHVRNRLNDMLAKMRAAESWPWEPTIIALYRETVWPYLYQKLPDREEAERFRAAIEAEIARLDAAGT